MLGRYELWRQVMARTPVKLRILCPDTYFANCCPDGKIPTHMIKRVIVTGGAGFVGSNLVWTLQDRIPGVQIVVLDDFRTGTFANLTCRAGDTKTFGGYVVGRSLSELDLSNVIWEFRPDVIFHEASITDTTVTDEAQMIRDNVEPFQELVDCATREKIKLVWASSAATYGTQANGATASLAAPFKLEDAGRPANVYGFLKVGDGEYPPCSRVAQTSGCPSYGRSTLLQRIRSRRAGQGAHGQHDLPVGSNRCSLASVRAFFQRANRLRDQVYVLGCGGRHDRSWQPRWVTSGVYNCGIWRGNHVQSNCEIVERSIGD